MSVISLMTDFGIKDGTVGVMKGVIWGICPTVQISDMSHMIPAQNIREAAFIFARSVPYVPKDSIHVVFHGCDIFSPEAAHLAVGVAR